MPRRCFRISHIEQLFFAAACALVFLCSLPVHAQSDDFPTRAGGRRGSLDGNVVTSTGERVNDVHVELRGMGGMTVAAVEVGPSGSFHFADLQPGWYELVAGSGAQRSITTVNISSFIERITIKVDSAPARTPSESVVSVGSLAVPSKARKAFEAADRLFRENNIRGSWERVEKALEAFPKYAAALTLRGLLKMQTNQPQQAVDDFTAALQADQGYQLAYTGLAADYNLMGKFDEALRVLDQGNYLASPSWLAHFEASKAFLAKKSFDRALAEADRAHSLLGQDLPMLNVVKGYAYIGLNDTHSGTTALQQYLQKESTGPLADKVRAVLASLSSH